MPSFRTTAARRRITATTACTALLLSLAPLGAVAAQAAPSSAAAHARQPRLHVDGTRHIRGTKGDLGFDVTVPDFAGRGSAAVDRRVTASVRTTVQGTAAENPGLDEHHTLGGVGKVTTRDGRTVQVAIEYTDFFVGAAHPTDTASTIVLRAGDASPVRLRDVFPDRRKAYAVLAKQVERIAAKRGEDVTDHSGLAARDGDWAAWQTTKHGFQVHFQDYQLGGHGLRVYTVPWKAVKPLMSKSAKALLAPRS